MCCISCPVKGNSKSGIFKKDHLFDGAVVLVPEGKKINISNTGNEPLTMYLISEPTPEDFKPIGSVLIKDENTTPIRSSDGHWTTHREELLRQGGRARNTVLCIYGVP